jgi:flagellar biosynthesis GTPase FlhF
MPKKMRRGAIRSALSERLREGNLIIVDEFGFKAPKTKDFLEAIGTLGLIENNKRAKTLIVDSLDNANLVLSSRNVQKTKITNSFGLNIYDLLYHEKVLISKTAVEELNNLLDPGTETSKVEEAAPKAKKEAKPKAEKADAPAEEAKPKKEAKPKAEKAEAPAEEAAPKKKAVKKEATDNE